jgi:hypothetical protein
MGKATAKLRSQMWDMWLVAGVGVLLASTAWIRGPYGVSGAAMIAIPFVLLPLASGLVTKYRLSRLAGVHPDRQQRAVDGETASAIRTVAGHERDASLAMRPRVVRLTMRGYLYTAGMTVLTAFVLWLLSLRLRGISGPSNVAIAKHVFAIFVYSWALWSCASFFRNRIRERRLFMNGELSQGYVLNQSETPFGRHIEYNYSDMSGTAFQKWATDFSKTLYEEMPIHIFYDPLNPRESAALESSLYRLD